MRVSISAALTARAAKPDFVFLTGDLGYDALEPLREAMQGRFINAGISEQNMISVAVGLAGAGLDPWCYSIAPFLYARPFEQIRNDACLHRLPVRLVANGGGYGYGVMGATHHAIEDYGALLSLQHMRVFVPAFAEDIVPLVELASSIREPIYYRLGRSEKPADYHLAPYSPWRRLVSGPAGVVLAVGPLAGSLLSAALQSSENARPTVWVVTELPVTVETLPEEFLDDVDVTGNLLVAEEHVRHGGVGETLAALLLEHGRLPKRYRLRCAAGYPSGTYGSQTFHRKESGLDAESILSDLVART